MQMKALKDYMAAPWDDVMNFPFSRFHQEMVRATLHLLQGYLT